MSPSSNPLSEHLEDFVRSCLCDNQLAAMSVAEGAAPTVEEIVQLIAEARAIYLLAALHCQDLIGLSSIECCGNRSVSSIRRPSNLEGYATGRRVAHKPSPRIETFVRDRRRSDRVCTQSIAVRDAWIAISLSVPSLGSRIIFCRDGVAGV
jgi:hypothetical protein